MLNFALLVRKWHVYPVLTLRKKLLNNFKPALVRYHPNRLQSYRKEGREISDAAMPPKACPLATYAVLTRCVMVDRVSIAIK